MPHPFESREISAWIEGSRAEQALRILSDPRLRPTRVGSDDARVRRQAAEQFGAEAFDDLRRLAVATPDALWINQSAPLAEAEREALMHEDIAIVAGACTLPFLSAVQQCETAPSFRRTQAGMALLGIKEAFGRVEVFQGSVAVASAAQLEEGLRLAVGSALAVLGPIDQVMAFAMRAGTLTASVVGRRGLGTIAVGVGADATSFTMIGEGGLAVVASAHVAWRRSDGTWVEETRLQPDLDEPTIQTILEAEKPTGTKRARRVVDDGHRRMRLRIAAVADAIRLSAQTGQRESVEELLRGFGIDPFDLVAMA
jgi:hypothetical protein